MTGGASGLGLAAAEQLAARGWHLGLLDRDGARLASAAEALRSIGSPHCEAFEVDTTAEAAVRYAVDSFAGRVGGLDLALNAAGVAVAGTLLETSAEDWQWILGINVMGVVNSCRAEAPHMLAAGRGLIINVASAASFAAPGCTSAYSASKAAVVALSESLFQEFAPRGVQVAVAMPGFFRTRPGGEDDGALEMEPGTVAREILARAAGGATHIVLPAGYRWLWRFKRLAPRLFMRRLAGIRREDLPQGG